VTGSTHHVILHWRSPGEASRLAARLVSLGVPPGQVLVVDNASGPVPLAELRRDLPEGVELLVTEANLGFAGGMNRGMEHARAAGASRVVLLNQDLELERGTLEAMGAAMDARPDAGLVGAVLLDGDRVAHAGETISCWSGALGRLPLPPEGTVVQPCDWVAGAALMVSVAALDEVGALDEAFWMYWEEVDLALRMTRAGWGVYLAPGARAGHKDAGDDPEAHGVRYLQWRNRWRLGRRNLRGLQLVAFQLSGLLFALRDLVGRALAGRFSTLWVPAKGTWDGMLGRSGPPSWAS
jgi:GT2 family glycosyltransferase